MRTASPNGVPPGSRVDDDVTYPSVRRRCGKLASSVLFPLPSIPSTTTNNREATKSWD